MSVKFNVSLYPPSGWVFEDTQGVKHSGKSLAQLVSRVVNYRVINHLPVADPAVEINNQLCANFPGYCKGAYSARPKRVAPVNRGCTSCGKKRRKTR